MKTENGQHLNAQDQEKPFPLLKRPKVLLTDDRPRLQLKELCERKTTASTRSAALKAGREQLEKAHKDYEKLLEQNMLEMEFGPSCECNRYPWQHELHPSGTARRDRQR
jgi:hypothetical protein